MTHPFLQQLHFVAFSLIRMSGFFFICGIELARKCCPLGQNPEKSDKKRTCHGFVLFFP